MEFEIGIGKTARRAYGFDEVAIVPSRRTRDPEDVSIEWEIDAYTFRLPMMASAMDAAVSPTTAIEIGRVGGLACLNLEGLWTRYEDPIPVYDEIAGLPDEKATRRMQELYAEPIKEELIGKRIGEIKEGGVVSCASLTPARVERYADLVLEAGLDILVIQGTVVSGEHVSSRAEPLNLKEFIPRFDIPVIVGGCASYSTALHLMRTGAVGVLVGVGPGNACTSRGVLGVGVPQATAIADAAAARREHLHETAQTVLAPIPCQSCWCLALVWAGLPLTMPPSKRMRPVTSLRRRKTNNAGWRTTCCTTLDASVSRRSVRRCRRRWTSAADIDRSGGALAQGADTLRQLQEAGRRRRGRGLQPDVQH